jgi:hypothetical protein
MNLTRGRTLIFDIIRLIVLIELSKKGDDITCMSQLPDRSRSGQGTDT